MPRPLAPASLLLLLVCACDEAGDAPSAVVRDSAGIAIVENPAPEGEPVLELPGEPEVDIGVLEGEEAYQLDQVRGSARLSDGRIAVLNGGSSEVRFFDGEGRYLQAAGRPGQGPGELRSPWLAGRLGDTLVVFDGGNQRLARVHPDGGIVAEHRAEAGVPFPQPVGVLGDGRALVRAGISFQGEAAGVARNPVPFVLLRPEGGGRDSLGAFPGPEMFHQGPRASRVPFARDTEAAVGGDRIYIATGEGWELRVLRPDGSLERLIRVAAPPEPVTPEALRAYIEAQVAAAPAEHQAGQRQHYAEMPAPAHYPPHGRLLVDRVGRLWVQDAERGSDQPKTWSVFDDEGRRIARVRTPPALRVHEIGEDYVIGVGRDDLDVAHVRVYALPSLD